MDDTKLQQLNKLLGALDTSAMSQEQIMKSFEAIIKHIEDVKKITLKEVEAIKSAYDTMLSKMKNAEVDYGSKFEELSNRLTTSVFKKLATVKNGKDGKDGRDGKDGERGPEGPQGRPGKDGAMGMMDEATVAYLENEIKIIKEKTNGGRTGWGAHPLKIMDGSTVVDKVARVINFGTNLSATRAPDGTITVNASGGAGGALNKETPTGTVDDSNTSFTVSNEPFFINVNGAIYEEGDGLYSSYVAGTITLSSPVGQGGFIKSYYA